MVYDWSFVDRIIGPYSSQELTNAGGKTYNDSYMAIKQNSLLCELTYCFITGPAYRRNFKHEEGHIYTLKVLNETDLIDYFIRLLSKNNITETEEELRFLEYYRYVTEGIAEYYADQYFKESYYTKFYKSALRYMVKTSSKGTENSYYIGGYDFIVYLLENSLYESLDDIINDLGSENLYDIFQKYKEINNLDSIEKIAGIA